MKNVERLIYLLVELFNAYLRRNVIVENSIGEFSSDCVG